MLPHTISVHIYEYKRILLSNYPNEKKETSDLKTNELIGSIITTYANPVSGICFTFSV